MLFLLLMFGVLGFVLISCLLQYVSVAEGTVLVKCVEEFCFLEERSEFFNRELFFHE